MKGKALLLTAAIVMLLGGPAGLAGQPGTQAATVRSTASSYWPKQASTINVSQNLILSESLLSQWPYSIDKGPASDWIQSTLGIHFTPAWVSPDDGSNTQKINVNQASGTLPDVIMGNGSVIASLAQSGQIMPLDALIAKYGSPLTKYVIALFQKTSNGGFLAPYYYQGKLYAIPTFEDVWAATWATNWIRDDLLKALGQPLPTTVDQMNSVLAAFHKAYPAKTGVLLWSGSADPWNPVGIGGMQTAMQPFGAAPGMWVKQNGKLVYGSVQPQVKQGLALLAQWYQKGYINKEFVTTNNAKADQMNGAGDVLSVYEPWWEIWSYMLTLYQAHPETLAVAYPPLSGPTNKTAVVLPAPVSAANDAVAINANFKSPQALVYFLNVTMDSMLRSDLPTRAAMQKQGYTFAFPYTAIQKPINPTAKQQADFIYRYKVPGPGYWNHQSFGSWGWQFNQLPQDLVDRYLRIINAQEHGTFAKLDPVAKDEYNRTITISPKRWTSNVSDINVWRTLVPKGIITYNQFTRPPTPTMLTSESNLLKLEQQTFVQIIMGQQPLSAFDQFVQQWNAQGGQQITAEMNK